MALAGGGALIATGVVRRGTDDLDFFAAHTEPIGPVLEAMEAALTNAGLRVTRQHHTDIYARLSVASHDDTTLIDRTPCGPGSRHLGRTVLFSRGLLTGAVRPL